MTQVVVIGGGIGGATAALRLAQDGAQVTLIEGGSTLGGLVTSFAVGGTPLERFYHHVFPQEHAIQALIDELGLADRLAWFPSTVGVLTQDRIWPFTSARDLLSFGPLRPVDRLRMGLGALWLGRQRDWERLDNLPAVRWLAAATGERATEVLWRPLLRGKFGPAWPTVPAAWMWGRFDQRAGARQDGRERLGYLRGGFRQVFDRLAQRLEQAGVQVALGERVERLRLADGDRVTGVDTSSRPLPADAVLFTGGLAGLARLVPPELADPRWSAVGRLGVLSVVLELAERLTPYYWVNVCDPQAPYGALIEHTNFAPVEDYGRHVVYLARYHTDDEPIATADPEQEADRWIADLAERFPGFDPERVLARHVFRAPYAAPLVTLGHASRIAPLRSHLPGLYVATTAQIYPHDRGMNDGIVLAAEAVDLLRADLGTTGGWACPVCGGRQAEPRFTSSSSGSECGVEASSFRPSSESFGQLAGEVVGCRRCGHGALAEPLAASAMATAYADAADPVTLRERAGQVETARRALVSIERFQPPGSLVDLGCWTGSFLVAARERGWQVAGVEPSQWAAKQARATGLEVDNVELADHAWPRGAHQLVVLCDVLEHLADPGGALEVARELLASGGVVYLTVPDAGSRLARSMGRRWWSVLPMHVQYFTRASMRRLLHEHGFTVLSTTSHAKVFTARYYAERLDGYLPTVARLGVRALEITGCADRHVAPDFRDRMQVIARCTT